MTEGGGLPRSQRAFLAWNDQDQGRHEWNGARPVRLPDPTRQHQRVLHALTARLIAATDPARVEVLPGMRLVAGDCVLRPDIAIILAGGDPAEPWLNDAVVIVEVAVGDPASAGPRWRAAAYAAVPSLAVLVMVDAGATSARMTYRADGSWQPPVLVTDTLQLHAVGADVCLSELRASRPWRAG